MTLRHLTRRHANAMSVAATVLLFLSALGPGRTVAQPAVAVDIPVFVQRIDSLREANKIPGLSIAVVKDRAILVATGLGYADPEHRIAAAADTPYNIASVTKPLSAVLAMHLVEAGTLDLDRPMAEYSDWADFCAAFSEQPSIFARDLRCDPPVHTLRHLLSHTATERAGHAFLL